MSRWLRCRWVADRLVAGVAGAVLAPIVAALALIVRRESPGPAIVGLTRVGVRREPFTMWKLRSMRVGSGDGSAGGGVLTVAGDDRITPIGARMRSLRIDELPQLLNMSRGEMALIGPRPETPSLVDTTQRWDEVLAARPGIAGATQLIVHGLEASMTDVASYAGQILPVKLAVDAWYARNASPSTDLLIVIGLAQSLLGGRTETALHRRVRAAVPEVARLPLDQGRS